jgi:hypothetical protein
VRLGISQGDIILSYNGLHDFTLHKLEEFLLSLGWELLASGDPSWNVGLEVYLDGLCNIKMLNLIYTFETSKSMLIFSCSLWYMMQLDMLLDLLPIHWSFLMLLSGYVFLAFSILPIMCGLWYLSLFS